MYLLVFLWLCWNRILKLKKRIKKKGRRGGRKGRGEVVKNTG